MGIFESLPFIKNLVYKSPVIIFRKYQGGIVTREDFGNPLHRKGIRKLGLMKSGITIQLPENWITSGRTMYTLFFTRGFNSEDYIELCFDEKNKCFKAVNRLGRDLYEQTEWRRVNSVDEEEVGNKLSKILVPVMTLLFFVVLVGFGIKILLLGK